MAEESILVDTTIAAPVDTVWRALRDPELIAGWFGWDAESLAEEIDFIFAKGSAEAEPGRRLDFSEWEGVADSFVLSPLGANTRLVVLRTGKPVAPGTYDEVVEGWISFVAQLRLMLEQHEDKRRTIYLSGNGRPGLGSLSKVLGLMRLVDAPVGTDYAAQPGPEDGLSGQVWHKSAFQLGLTVGEWGNGLLIVADRPVTLERPDGGGYVILTTYGLAEADFVALEQRWRDWWAATYLAP